MISVDVSTGDDNSLIFVDERPSATPSVSVAPSSSPSAEPSVSPAPSYSPSAEPSVSAAPSDRILGSISGNVSEDVDNNDTGDVDLAGVTVKLLENGVEVATTVTDSNGDYFFYDVPVGNYVVMQVNLPGFLDVTDSDGVNDNMIAVTVNLGQNVTDRDFVDEQERTIRGKVLEDIDNNDTGDDPIPNVVVRLVDENGVVVQETVTNSQGLFEFTGVPPGMYTVREVNPPGFVDVGDSDGGDPNVISVDVSSGDDSSLIFVDERPSATPTVSVVPSDSPSSNPTGSSVPSIAPSSKPSVSTAPSRSPSSEPSVSVNPTIAGSAAPSRSVAPSGSPSEEPTVSGSPSTSPSDEPSVSPRPSSSPSEEPTRSPEPTNSSSEAPTVSSFPSSSPSSDPTGSFAPSESPSVGRRRDLEYSGFDGEVKPSPEDVKSDCAEASKLVDVHSVAVDQCVLGVFGVFDESPIALESQNGDSVTFTVKQVWKGTASRKNVSGTGTQESIDWFAADYEAADGSLQCSRYTDVAFGKVATLTAQCSDGWAIIDLYARHHDLFGQQDGSGVLVPSACQGSMDGKSTCHFRYVLKCSPSRCSPAKGASTSAKPMRESGVWKRRNHEQRYVDQFMNSLKKFFFGF